MIDPVFATSPFQFGVASSPLKNVLWTRLAVEPLAPDGRGGMPDGDVPVVWKVALDAGGSHVIASGTALALGEWGHSVHQEVPGLPEDSEIFYWFEYGDHRSVTGRLRTAPNNSALPLGMSAALVSCANFEHGYFHCYSHIAVERVDVIVVLGDYVYADTGDLRGGMAKVRQHLPAKDECLTLADYRLRHSQYRADPREQAMRASAGMIATFDDHDIDDNWAASLPDDAESVGARTFWQRKENALRAYWENLPLPISQQPRLSLMPASHPTLRWGNLAHFHLLDTRQFRSKLNRKRKDDDHQYLLGPTQLSSLGQSYRGARWDFLTNQVAMASWEIAGYEGNIDSWDGYARERDRLTAQWAQHNVRNPVVLTGDIHMAGAFTVRDAAHQLAAPEIVTSSITAGGDLQGDWTEADASSLAALLLSKSDIHMLGRRRGWVHLDIHRATIDVRWRGTPIVMSLTSQPDHTFASAQIRDGGRTFSQPQSMDDVDFTWS
ncbi:alkaline phosphatase D family protein [Streptomyces sp. Lzd4kr]|nr:alkaline phosphatase D family protein [Streptomyces sp. Lzd4kr]